MAENDVSVRGNELLETGSSLKEMTFRLRSESGGKTLARGKGMCKGLKVERAGECQKTKAQHEALVIVSEVIVSDPEGGALIAEV